MSGRGLEGVHRFLRSVCRCYSEMSSEPKVPFAQRKKSRIVGIILLRIKDDDMTIDPLSWSKGTRKHLERIEEL